MAMMMAVTMATEAPDIPTELARSDTTYASPIHVAYSSLHDFDPLMCE